MQMPAVIACGRLDPGKNPLIPNRHVIEYQVFVILNSGYQHKTKPL